jgi:hypothetical protein
MTKISYEEAIRRSGGGIGEFEYGKYQWYTMYDPYDGGHQVCSDMNSRGGKYLTKNTAERLAHNLDIHFSIDWSIK